jgi:hypothetical protein
MAIPTIEEVVQDLENVLKIANHLSYLWTKDGPLYGEDLRFTSTFLAPDESWWMAVQHKNGKFRFHERYNNKGLSPLEASKALLNVHYSGDPGALTEDFKLAIKKPLGEYLAEREISKLQL